MDKSCYLYWIEVIRSQVSAVSLLIAPVEDRPCVRETHEVRTAQPVTYPTHTAHRWRLVWVNVLKKGCWIFKIKIAMFYNIFYTVYWFDFLEELRIPRGFQIGPRWILIEYCSSCELFTSWTFVSFLILYICGWGTIIASVFWKKTWNNMQTETDIDFCFACRWNVSWTFNSGIWMEEPVLITLEINWHLSVTSLPARCTNILKISGNKGNMQRKSGCHTLSHTRDLCLCQHGIPSPAHSGKWIVLGFHSGSLFLYISCSGSSSLMEQKNPRGEWGEGKERTGEGVSDGKREETVFRLST